MSYVEALMFYNSMPGQREIYCLFNTRMFESWCSRVADFKRRGYCPNFDDLLAFIVPYKYFLSRSYYSVERYILTFVIYAK